MAKKQQKQSSGFRKLVLYGTGAFAIGGILIYSFTGPNLAAETMAMQQKVLMEGKDFASSKEKIREIMQNIDLMPAKEIYKVRRDLGRSVGQLSKQSAEKFLQLSGAERTAFLDEGIEKRHCSMQQIRVVCLRELRLILKDTNDTVRKEKPQRKTHLKTKRRSQAMVRKRNQSRSQMMLKKRNQL
jgi:hypothetical protein